MNVFWNEIEIDVVVEIGEEIEILIGGFAHTTGCYFGSGFFEGVHQEFVPRQTIVGPSFLFLPEGSFVTTILYDQQLNLLLFQIHFLQLEKTDLIGWKKTTGPEKKLQQIVRPPTSLWTS